MTRVSPSVMVVSDTHLSGTTPEALRNWDAVVGEIEQTQPGLVVHLGDLTLNGDPRDLVEARASLDQLSVPWLAVPGNHDIGDNPWDGGAELEAAVSPERVARWLERVGADHWSVDVGCWRLLAINAQLLGSGLEAEILQWNWLEAELHGCAVDRPIAIVLHKPIEADGAELAAAPAYRFVPTDARSRLRSLFEERTVPLVLSGHVHQFRMLAVGGREHVWAPSTWAVLPDEVQPTFGVKRCGLLSIWLPAEPIPEVELVEPHGLRQLTLTRDIPDPYSH